MKQVKINELLWDTENLVINGKEYFTWAEAIYFADSLGKRLPTKEEWESIIDMAEYNKSRNGIYINDKKLFLPMKGYIDHRDQELKSKGEEVMYWSSSIYYKHFAYNIFFNEGYSSRIQKSNIVYKYPVRCVISDPHLCYYTLTGDMK